MSGLLEKAFPEFWDRPDPVVKPNVARMTHSRHNVVVAGFDAAGLGLVS
jgi:hypothetical protein